MTRQAVGVQGPGTRGKPLRHLLDFAVNISVLKNKVYFFHSARHQTQGLRHAR